jgi:ABC-2 type transport system permease protein
MNKYLAIFKTSFQQEFAYPVNFVMWRIRNILTFFLTFFLWDTVYRNPNTNIFGYDRAKIMTYVFLVVFLRAIVVSAKTVNIAGEISDGKLSNYLLKPINFFYYWFTRDVASKVLNCLFAVVEVFILYLLFVPTFFSPQHVVTWFMFLVFLIIAIVLFFLLIFLFSSVPLWLPEQNWAPVFLFYTITEFLSGAFFPLDILPKFWQTIVYLTPFPYLIFVPSQIYLEKVDMGQTLFWLAVGVGWCIGLYVLLISVWKKGLKSYKSEGR